MAYNLTLHFTAGDRTVSVLKEGYSSGNQVGARGKHATQTCQLSIRSYEVSAMLLQEEAPLIRGELKDDDLVIFQGVVRPYQTVSAKNATENVFSLQLMDDTEILKNASITDTEEYLDKTLAWCVQYLYDMADIPEQLDMPGELSEIPIPFFNLNPERYPKVSEQLEAMLWEYGYDYKFSGTVCRIIRTWIESAAGIGTVNVRNTLRVQRDDNWSDGVKANYGIMEICRQIPLASWKEDVSDLQWWRYALPWSYSTSAGRAKRTVAYDPFYGLPASSKPKDFKTEYILSAQNLRTNASRCEIHSVTPHAQSVEIDFSWDVTQNYVWGEPVADWPYITVVGDIIYAVPGDYQENIVGEKPDEYTLVYIRNEEGAKAFAEREYKRAKCAPITFSFQSLENYEAGSFYSLADSVTGINAVIRILSCSMDANGIYTVKAESADYIGMVVEVEELRLRDALDVGASVVLTASTDAVGEGASVTVTASGRLLDIIEVEGDETFSYEWELNDEHVPAWDDEKEITATFSELGDDNNVFKFNVYHSEGGQKILIGTGLVSTLKTVEGKDGDSAEIQYAIGDSFVDPPQDDMLWNGELMTWDSEAMTWNDGEYSADVPEMERARYIWMRTRVGDNEWQYTRLTGTTSWDPENLGVATTETPKHSKEGLGLVDGDYFVAGATFTEDGVTYSAGFAYIYNGTSWDPMDITSADNARKAADLLDSLITGNVQIPSSDNRCSMWVWAKNLAAQNAVIRNLFAQNITILEDGCIHSEYYKDDGTPDLQAEASTDSESAPVEDFDENQWFETVGYVSGTFSWRVTGGHPWGFDCEPIDSNPYEANTDADLENYGLIVPDARYADDGDIYTVTVSSRSGARSGFWLGANGELKCQSAEAKNITITGDSIFQGTLNCDVIKTVRGGARVTGTYSAASGVLQAKTLIESFPASIKPNYPHTSSSMVYNWSDYIPVQMTPPGGTASDIAYVRLYRENFRGTLIDGVYFYDAARNQLDVKNYYTCSGTANYLRSKTVSGSVTEGTYATTTVTINTIVASNLLQVDIPNSNSGLTKGQLYYDQTTGIVKIQMT